MSELDLRQVAGGDGRPTGERSRRWRSPDGADGRRSAATAGGFDWRRTPGGPPIRRLGRAPSRNHHSVGAPQPRAPACAPDEGPGVRCTAGRGGRQRQLRHLTLKRSFPGRPRLETELRVHLVNHSRGGPAPGSTKEVTPAACRTPRRGQLRCSWGVGTTATSGRSRLDDDDQAVKVCSGSRHTRLVRQAGPELAVAIRKPAAGVLRDENERVVRRTCNEVSAGSAQVADGDRSRQSRSRRCVRSRPYLVTRNDVSDPQAPRSGAPPTARSPRTAPLPKSSLRWPN